MTETVKRVKRILRRYKNKAAEVYRENFQAASNPSVPDRQPLKAKPKKEVEVSVAMKEIVDKIRFHNTAISDLLFELETLENPNANPYEGPLDFYQRNFFMPLEDIGAALPEITCRRVDLKLPEYEAFLEKYLPWHEKIAKAKKHKKKQELFISFHLLGERVFQSYLDAAGGGFSYAGTLKAKRSVLQDMEIRDAVRNRCGPDVQYVESSLSKIPLEDNSMDAISSHHSFEHFQGTADMDFIQEAQRILKKGGMLALVPLFISKDHIEMTNLANFSNWSTGEENRIFDADATLPGKKSGNFARIYNPKAFRERILSKIDLKNFSVELVEMTMEGVTIPDPVVYKNHKVSNFNYPYRAFIMTRK